MSVKTAPKTIALPPNLREFLERGGDPSSVVEPQVVGVLAGEAVQACYRPSAERTFNAITERGHAAKWAT